MTYNRINGAVRSAETQQKCWVFCLGVCEVVFYGGGGYFRVNIGVTSYFWVFLGNNMGNDKG